MKRLFLMIVAVALTLTAGSAFATPSTHVWAPSTDVQPYGVFHLTVDTYLSAKGEDTLTGGAKADRPASVTDIGLTVGVLPLEKLQLELGFDHITGYGFFKKNDLDSSPFYYNAKLGIPEGALVKDVSPAIAVGGYMFGTKTGGEARAGKTAKAGTDFDVVYAKAAKTIGSLGRFSAGYYTGNEAMLVDEYGRPDEDGIMLCWERTMSEISENLWVSVDYMGGDSAMGALSYGFAWKFAPNVSAIFGYVDQNNDDLGFVEDWFTVQVDVDLAVFDKKK